MFNEPKILKETNFWLAVDKPAGIAVHDVIDQKYAGKTVVDWLLKRYPKLNDLAWPDQSRPGIVHRLDADTSGLLLLAKDPKTLENLQDQFRQRKIKKVYWALVLGQTPERGELSGNIERVAHDTRHRVKRLAFSWEKQSSKAAFTSYKRLHIYTFQVNGKHLEGVDMEGVNNQTKLSLLELYPKTGRTHQLRVQLLDAGFPILGDQLYNTKESREVSKVLRLNRQFLHAQELNFTDPQTHQMITLESPLARDLQALLDQLN